jgi:SAM-dependent methyltransferase
MEIKDQLNEAIYDAKRLFPFVSYIGKSHYYELNSILSNLIPFMPKFKGRKLLDIGCGPMDKTAILQLMGFRCFAVDDLNDSWHHRKDNTQKIKAYAKKIGIVFHHQNIGDCSYPFEFGSFDVVCALAVIEHLHESPREFLNFMGRYARPGGVILITTPNSVNLRKRLSVLAGRTNYPPVDMFFQSIGEWRGHVREYTLKETAYICNASGFEVLFSNTFEHIAYFKLRTPLRQMYLLMGHLLPTLRSSILVICRKPEGWKPTQENPQKFRNILARGIPKGVV